MKMEVAIPMVERKPRKSDCSNGVIPDNSHCIIRKKMACGTVGSEKMTLSQWKVRKCSTNVQQREKQDLDTQSCP